MQGRRIAAAMLLISAQIPHDHFKHSIGFKPYVFVARIINVSQPRRKDKALLSGQMVLAQLEGRDAKSHIKVKRRNRPLIHARSFKLCRHLVAFD